MPDAAGILIVEGLGRKMAVSRQKVIAKLMINRHSGPRYAMEYLQEVFGKVSGSAGPVVFVKMDGAFRLNYGGPLQWLEVDSDSWQDLLPYMHSLRLT